MSLAMKSTANQHKEHNVGFLPFSGLQRCRSQYMFFFIRLAVVASEICEIPRNSPKIQT